MDYKLFQKSSITLIVTLISTIAIAQQIDYKVLKDNPKDVNNFWLYLDVAQLDAGFKNIDGISFNVGAWSTGIYKEKIIPEVILRYGWVTFGKTFAGAKGVHNHHQVEIGGGYVLSNKTKYKQTSVVLSQTKGHDYGTGKDVTTTRYINIPATRVNSFGVRAGLMSVGGLLSTDDYKAFITPKYINYSINGIYAGIFDAVTHNIIINTNTDGKAAKCKRTKVFADVLLLPLQTATFAGVNYKPVINAGPVGYRIGLQYLPTEIRKVTNIDVKITGLSIGAEAGVRPYDGIYVACNLSFCLMRKKMAALGYTVPEEEKRTAE